MRVATGSDHRGLEQRAWAVAAVEVNGHVAVDLGTFSQDSCDYPDIAAAVARAVSVGNADRGILLCGTGIGVSIVANKISGIRAAVCHDLRTAELSRRHNDANVLCLSGDVLDQQQVETIVKTWLSTPFDGGRHERRIEKIRLLEQTREQPHGC